MPRRPWHICQHLRQLRRDGRTRHHAAVTLPRRLRRPPHRHEELAQRPDLLEPLDSIAIPANFELTADGIRFIYGLYEIAPYSSGEVSVDISGYELDSLLSADGRRLILGEM